MLWVDPPRQPPLAAESTKTEWQFNLRTLPLLLFDADPVKPRQVRCHAVGECDRTARAG